MTERWISTKKHYCKYCNTWIPDTKVSRQQHEQTDRHKNHMQRNLSRLQRDELIKRTSGYNPQPLPKPAAAKPTMRNARANMTNYGYGDRDDMVGFIRDGKKMKFDNIPTAPAPEAYVSKAQREGSLGEWKVSKIVSQEEDGDLRKVELEDEVKKEESPEPSALASQLEEVSAMQRSENKRERQKTPDAEDLIKFRVQEKTFPVDINDEEEVKAPVVGFKKRKVGQKNARVSTVL